MDLLQTSLTIMQYSKMATVNCNLVVMKGWIILIQIKSKKQISRLRFLSVSILKFFTTNPNDEDSPLTKVISNTGEVV
jgi:hypothetical protein